MLHSAPFEEEAEAAPLITPPTPEVSVWIPTSEFALLANITPRAARNALTRCNSGGTWRGHTMQARLVEGNAGQGGKALQVNAATLPPALRDAWHARHPELFRQPDIPFVTPPLHVPEVEDANMADDWADARWKLDLLYPALTQRPRTPGRGEEIRGIVAREHRHWTGKMVRVSRRWCEKWISRFEAAEYREKGSGIFALMRKPRTDKEGRRVLVCVRWQTACPLPDEEKQRIAAAVGTYINSEWASGAPSWQRVEMLASAKLLELSRVAGWTTATLDDCRIGRHAAERGRPYRIIAIHDQDAKKFHDLYQPRVQRIRDDLLPMELVVGDVHPVDILVYREDGSQATARAIAWLDLATNRVHVTLILLRPREGVKQIHVAQAFVAMVRAWGLPRRLYLDNGSEYSWEAMMEGFRLLAAMVSRFQDFKADFIDHEEVVDQVADEDEPIAAGSSSDESGAIIRAQPYNAQAKAIEGIFGVLETTVFPMIRGYIGGNRMAKKTHNVGKAPKPFPGGFPAFHAALETAIDFYHRQPQKRDGKSPFDRLEAFIAQGWRAVKAPETALLFAFSTLEPIQVRNSGITLTSSGETKTYWHDDMIPLIQSKTAVRHAKHDPGCIFFQNSEGKWIAAPEGPRFRVTDRDGAREKGRRAKLSKAHVNELRANVTRLDLVEEMAAFNALAPNPETPFGAEIALTPEMQELADARAQIGKLPARPALPPGKVFDEASGKVVDMFPALPEDDEGDELPSEADFWRAAGQRAANGEE